MIQLFFIFLGALVAHDLLKFSCRKLGIWLINVKANLRKKARTRKRERLAEQQAKAV